MGTNRITFLASLILVVFLSFYYLSHKELGFREIPQTTDILDERNYIWAAKSFLQTGIPTAWSNLEAYGRTVKKNIEIEDLSIKFKGEEKPSWKNIKKFDYPVVAVTKIDIGKGPEHILFVQPFFDHSFLAGLIYGLNTPNDITSFTDIQPQNYRLMAIYVSLITGLLLFLVTYLLYRHPLTALLAFLIYSTVGIYLLVSRYALIENILIPLTLLSLLFLVLSNQPWISQEYQKRIFWVLGGVSAGLALTTKELGIAVLLAGVLILLVYKISRKEILYFLIPAVIFGSPFYFYAFWVAPKLFLEIFFNQVSRGFFGPLNFLYSFVQPHFSGFPLEGYWVFGLIALLFLVKKFESHREIVISFLSYLLVFLFFGGLSYPWYWLVFVPFMVIASALFIKELLFNPSLDKIVIFFLFPLSSSLYWGHDVFHQSAGNILIYRIFILVFLVLSAFCFLQKKIPGIRIIMTLAIFLVLWKMFQWNHYGFEYWVANWGKLPEPFFLKP